MAPRGKKNKPDFNNPQPDSIREEINRKAYERFELRGRIHGFHVEDWLEAEREVLGGKKNRTAARTGKGVSPKRLRMPKGGAAERSPGV